MATKTLTHFHVGHRDAQSKARAGVLQTAHGPVETPVFMPVGTQGTVKTLGSEDLQAMGSQIILSNTYHLFLRPGLDVLKKAGGLHSFMAWPGAILTDSGGYQVFSLAMRCKQSEEGVEFQSHVDGARHHLTPEITTNFQLDIGADVAMCLDDCPPYPSLEAEARASMEKTLRWAERCRRTYLDRVPEGTGPRQHLFAITQGASFPEMRKESAERTVEMDFPGYAVGGLGLGESKSLFHELLEASLAPMPEDAPRYLMGIGQPEDLWEGVARGVDMFDCVLPTRNGRNGQAFTSIGKVNVPNARHREDFAPLDPSCACPVCGRYTRAYLCHLFRAGELLGPRLVTLHNLWFMLGLMRSIRSSIIHGNFLSAKSDFLRRYQSVDE
ncbi:MAG: tRNA guanosine(34) transglycosylase Tgt [Elusimicrobia bacterium]|nr:tRNA guanosine(34) transglycosylase Tgt [Elusimicrobiota bacterium]